LKLHADAPTALNTVTAYGPGFIEINKVRHPEVALLGTGSRQRFPHPRLSRALNEARIGLEVMTTAAACRTYNILMAEGRKVAAALLLESES
jgi:uncharacterized protein